MARLDSSSFLRYGKMEKKKKDSQNLGRKHGKNTEVHRKIQFCAAANF